MRVYQNIHCYSKFCPLQRLDLPITEGREQNQPQLPQETLTETRGSREKTRGLELQEQWEAVLTGRGGKGQGYQSSLGTSGLAQPLYPLRYQDQLIIVICASYSNKCIANLSQLFQSEIWNMGEVVFRIFLATSRPSNSKVDCGQPSCMSVLPLRSSFLILLKSSVSQFSFYQITYLAISM